jgi:hypothetical protein
MNLFTLVIFIDANSHLNFSLQLALI